MAGLSALERRFLLKNELCRMATASSTAVPHVVPVIYALDGDDFAIAVDYHTRKLRNLMENPLVALIIDDYDPNRAVMIQGKCKIYERGKEYLRLLKVLFDRFEYYRDNPWGEGESPILLVTPGKVVSWGLGR